VKVFTEVEEPCSSRCLTSLFHVCVFHCVSLHSLLSLKCFCLQGCSHLRLFPLSREYFDPARLRLHVNLSSTEWGSPSALTPSQFDTARIGESGTGVIVPGG
jgi:hypothetical protein